jgi:hypothetical protein
MKTIEEIRENEQRRFELGDPRIMVERLKEGYISLCNTAKTAADYGYIEPKFAATFNNLVAECFYRMKQRLESQPGYKLQNAKQ